MSRLLGGMVLACSACEVVFPRAAAIEAPPDAALPAGPRCERVGERITLPLVADSFLASADTVAHGSDALLAIYTPTASRALLRFETRALKLSAFDLTLKPRRLCGSPCTPCTNGDAGGRIAVRATRPDWDEATATEQLRSGTTPWLDGPGPVAPDASDALVGGSIFVSPSDAFTLAIDTSSVDRTAWPSTDELSLLLFPDDTAFEVSAAFASKDDACANPGDAPLLTAVCTREALCGNGAIDDGEACDDGNNDDDDACTNACAVAAT